MRGCFVTGTDTDVGKTFVSCLLLSLLREKNPRVAGFKPVAAGIEREKGECFNADTEAFYRACAESVARETISPFVYEEAIAPHIAAKIHERIPTVEKLLTHYQENFAEHFTVVEGAGGWLVPLNEHESLADLAKALALPVLLVVKIQLGCINHALLTAEAIKASGLKLAGWVANDFNAYEWAEDNIATLKERISAPLLATFGQCANYEQALENFDQQKVFEVFKTN